MRSVTLRSISALAIVGAAAAGALSWTAMNAAVKPSADVSALGADDDPLIVHEWGTFTNFAGSDGVRLEFRPLVDHELPAFVHDRTRLDMLGLTKALIRAPVRMETPVTYFYSKRPRDVRVKVAFPDGLLTEFFPPPQKLGPPVAWGEPQGLKNSFLDWGKVRLIPQELFAKTRVTVGRREEAAKLEPVKGDDHYGYARHTDSAIVEALDPLGSANYEKFLFYRGVGQFPLPITVEALGGDRFCIKNFGDKPIGGLFMTQIVAGQVRFTEAPALPAGGTLNLSLPCKPSSIDQLAERVQQALVATGLYDKEARAMVDTWRSSWFGESGTRLLYLLPQSFTDRVLPLTISPAPKEFVRVLVGRAELMTPEQEQQLRSTIEGAGTCLLPAGGTLATQLKDLGRFAEPALQRLLETTSDPAARQAIERLLKEVRPAGESAG